MSFLLDDKQHNQETDWSTKPDLNLFITNLVEENKSLKERVHKIADQKDVLKQNCFNLTKSATERENKIEKLERQLTTNNNLPTSSWVKGLVQTNQQMSNDIQIISTQNQQLTEQCTVLTKMVKVKTDEVEILQRRIKVLEDERKHFIDAKEETYSALVQELFKEIELLSEKVQVSSKENDRVAKETSKIRKEEEVEGKNQREQQIDNAFEENTLYEVTPNYKLIKENEELKEENKELKELVEFLELERKCMIEEDLIAQDSKTADENEKKHLLQENSKLKTEVQTWSKGYAAMMKKEEKLLNELDMIKKRSVKVGHVAKKEMQKRKFMTKKYKKLANKLKTMKKICREKVRQRRSSKLQEDCSIIAKECTWMEDIHELTQKNQKLVELIDFLEAERKYTLEDVDELKEEIVKKEISREELHNQITDMKSELRSTIMRNEEIQTKFDSLKNDLDRERLEKYELERASKMMETKYEDLKAKLDNEFEKNSVLQLKIMEYEDTIDKNSKASLNCFQKLFRRRTRA